MKKNIQILFSLFVLTFSISCNKDLLKPNDEREKSSLKNKAKLAAITIDNYATKLKDLAPFPIGIETEVKVIELQESRNPNAIVRLSDHFTSLTLRLYNGELYPNPSTTSWGK